MSRRFALCIWLRILPQLPQLLPAHSLKSDHHGVRAPVTHSCRYLQALHLRASVIINMQSSWNRFRNRNSVLIPNSLSLYTCFTCMLILRRLLRRTVCRQIIGGKFCEDRTVLQHWESPYAPIGESMLQFNSSLAVLKV